MTEDPPLLGPLPLNETMLRLAGHAPSSFASLREIEALSSRWEAVPKRFDWTWISSDAPPEQIGMYFQRQIKRMGVSFEPSYVEGATVMMRGDVNGYMHMLAVRTHELSVWGVRMLAQECVLPAAPLARSALEVAAFALRAADLWRRMISAENKENLHDASTLLEGFIAQGMFATGAPESKVTPVNILTVMKHARRRRREDVECQYMFDEAYSQLSDLVHPNAGGHQMYWQEPPGGWEDPRVHQLPLHLVIDPDRPNELLRMNYVRCLGAIAFAGRAVLGARDEVSSLDRWCPKCKEMHSRTEWPHAEDIVIPAE